MQVHNFGESKATGQQGELELDFFFKRWYEIDGVERKLDRAGIDRIFTEIESRETATVQYKTDNKSCQTGNIFIETETDGKPGCHLTSTAQHLITYLPISQELYIISPDRIRKLIDGWKERYREAQVYNYGFSGKGVPVPVAEFARHSMRVDMTKFEHWVNGPFGRGR
jgi:hypothetical protein